MSKKMTCLVIKPAVANAEGRETQNNAIKNAICRAIEQAGLQLVGDENGLEISEITTDIVKMVHEADVVVVDANNYDSGTHGIMSPYLTYFLGLRHSLGNQTILVANGTDHLPDALCKHHTLIYRYEKIWEFYDRFKQTVKKIESGRPDNLIQEYRQALEYQQKAAELARTQAELKAKEAQLAALRQQQSTKTRPTINFRRVN